MTDDRLTRMKDAQSKLREVCQILESLIDGHVLERHAQETLDELMDILDSDANPGSFRNMIRCIEVDEGTPGWSRPLDSVKHVFRKD